MEAERRASVYMEVLRESAHMLSGVLHEPEVVRILLDLVASVLHAKKAVVLLLGRDGDELLNAGAMGLGEAYLTRWPMRLSKSPLAGRAMPGEAVFVADAASEPEFRDEEASRESLGSVVAVPLLVRSNAIGLLHVYNVSIGAETGSESLILLGALADLAALSLEKARLHRSLFRIAEALNSSMDLNSMLQRVLEATVEEMWIKAASIRFLDAESGILRPMAAYGLSDAYRAKGDVHLAKSEIDRRVIGGEIVVLYDVEHEKGFEYQAEAAREGILSVLAVPIKLKDRVLGVLRVYSTRPRHFGSVASTFLEAVADLVGLATENAELYAALHEHNKNLKIDLADWHRFLALG